jgi:hypothetical protein
MRLCCVTLCVTLCRLEITPVADIRYPSGDLCVDIINECVDIDTQACPIATIPVSVLGMLPPLTKDAARSCWGCLLANQTYDVCLNSTPSSAGDSCIPGGQCINEVGFFHCAPVLVPTNAPLIPTPGGAMKITDQQISFMAFGMLFASYCDRCESSCLVRPRDGALSWQTSEDPK